MHASTKRHVVDAHVHLYDGGQNRYEHLELWTLCFKRFIGDYSTLPRRYLFEDYLGDESALEIDGMVWHEFMSADPLREVDGRSGWPTRCRSHGDCGLVDFLAPDLERGLRAMRSAGM